MTTKPTPTVYSVRDRNCAKKYELPSETRRLNHETTLINSSHSAYNTWSNHHLPDRSTCHVPFRSHLPSFYPYEYRVSRRSVFSWFSFLISKPQVILTITVQLNTQSLQNHRLSHILLLRQLPLDIEEIVFTLSFVFTTNSFLWQLFLHRNYPVNMAQWLAKWSLDYEVPVNLDNTNGCKLFSVSVWFKELKDRDPHNQATVSLLNQPYLCFHATISLTFSLNKAIYKAPIFHTDLPLSKLYDD